MLLLPFFKVPNYSWNLPTEMLSKVFAVAFLIYNALFFILFSTANAIQISTLAVSAYRRTQRHWKVFLQGSFLLLIFIAAARLTADMVYPFKMEAYLANKDAASYVYFSSQYIKHVYLLMNDWGLLLPLSMWGATFTFVGYIRYLLQKNN
jgi:hypothetical protein